MIWSGRAKFSRCGTVLRDRACAILFAKDVARLRTFYSDALRLAVCEGASTGDWVRLEAGGASLALHAIHTSIAEGIVIDDPRGT